MGMGDGSHSDSDAVDSPASGVGDTSNGDFGFDSLILGGDIARLGSRSRSDSDAVDSPASRVVGLGEGDFALGFVLGDVP